MRNEIIATTYSTATTCPMSNQNIIQQNIPNYNDAISLSIPVNDKLPTYKDLLLVK